MRRLGTIHLTLSAALAAGAAPATRQAVSPTPAEAQVAFAAAAARMVAAQTALVGVRQQAVADFRASPAYVAAARELSAAFDAYAERRNGLLMGLGQTDRRIAAWRKGVADADDQLARAGQDPAVTPDAFGELLKERAGFANQLQAAEEDAINRDPDAKRRQQAWRDASAKVADAQSKQAAAVEGSPAVRSAVAALADATAAFDRARAALPAGTAADDPTPTADEFVRRYPRHGPTWSDAGLSYGGTAGTAGGKD